MTRISTARSSLADIRHQLPTMVAALARGAIEVAALVALFFAVVIWAAVLTGRV